MEWTEEKVRKVLRQAGYKSTGVTGCYAHPVTRHTINLYDWVNGREYWRTIAEREKLPDPPQVVANYRGAWWQISIMEGENGKMVRFDQLLHVVTEETAVEVAQAILEGVGDG